MPARPSSDPVPETLARLFERPPAELAVQVPGRQPWAVWRESVTAPRLLVAAALSPPMFLVYRDAVDGSPPTGVGWNLLLGAVAVVAALLLATYVPQRAAGRGSSPCAALAVVQVLLAGMVLDAPADPLFGVLALGFVSFGLTQRLRGSRACG
ncbi:MAG: hypothetical protein U0R80_08815 [Nocardioidaceae bacterium]